MDQAVTMANAHDVKHTKNKVLWDDMDRTRDSDRTAKDQGGTTTDNHAGSAPQPSRNTSWQHSGTSGAAHARKSNSLPAGSSSDQDQSTLPPISIWANGTLQPAVVANGNPLLLVSTCREYVLLPSGERLTATAQDGSTVHFAPGGSGHLIGSDGRRYGLLPGSSTPLPLALDAKSGHMLAVGADGRPCLVDDDGQLLGSDGAPVLGTDGRELLLRRDGNGRIVDSSGQSVMLPGGQQHTGVMALDGAGQPLLFADKPLTLAANGVTLLGPDGAILCSEVELRELELAFDGSIRDAHGQLYGLLADGKALPLALSQQGRLLMGMAGKPLQRVPGTGALLCHDGRSLGLMPGQQPLALSKQGQLLFLHTQQPVLTPDGRALNLAHGPNCQLVTGDGVLYTDRASDTHVLLQALPLETSSRPFIASVLQKLLAPGLAVLRGAVALLRMSLSRASAPQ